MIVRVQAVCVRGCSLRGEIESVSSFMDPRCPTCGAEIRLQDVRVLRACCGVNFESACAGHCPRVRRSA